MLSQNEIPFSVHSYVKDFEEDYTFFKEKVADYDRQLGNILCLAYKDCSGLESIFKVSSSQQSLKIVK